MSIVPNRFYFRIAHPCHYVAGIPFKEADELVDLPPKCRLENFAAMDSQKNFAEIRLAWNELGLAVQLDVRGKSAPPQGRADRPRASDGLILWVDTRGDRTSHRATRYCHQFYLLAAGAGEDHDQPIFLQTQIHRALEDAPKFGGVVPLRVAPKVGGYRLEAFIPAEALHGFDPEEHRHWGIFYAVRDLELGEQTLSVGADFPFAEDPSLWSTLELIR
jgi:hypothetical protein